MTDPVAHIPPFDPGTLGNALGEVMNEIDRQDRLARAGKFGGTHLMPGGTDLERLAVLTEEFGEAGTEVTIGIRHDGYYRQKNLRTELVQVAAVAIAWVAAIDERRAP